jgi:hypothetical protein
MSITSLQDFVTKTAAKSRITFGDVRRLQRDVLPDGVSSRDQAELLISLDAEVARADGSWTDWLVAAIIDFAVWREDPAGAVESDAAQWLKDRLAAGGTLTKAARRIAREIRREAERVEEPMASLATDEPQETDETDEAEDESAAAEMPVVELIEVTAAPMQVAA